MEWQFWFGSFVGKSDSQNISGRTRVIIGYYERLTFVHSINSSLLQAFKPNDSNEKFQNFIDIFN